MSDTPSPLLSALEDAFSKGGEEAALRCVLEHFGADGGTLHRMGDDGQLHLSAAFPPMPPALLEKITVIPVGKGMAGLAVERGEPVQSCNLQEDTTGDVRPGAKQTGLQGSTCVPVLRDGDVVGALGIGTLAERTFSDEENALLMEAGRRLAGEA